MVAALTIARAHIRDFADTRHVGLAGRGTPAHRALGRENYKLTRLTQKTKGLGIAGALLLSACSRPDQALNDTYYVVSNTSPFLFLTTLTVIVEAA